MISREKVILDVIRDLERARRDVDLAQVNQRKDILERIDPAIAGLTRAVQQLLEGLQPDARRSRFLQGTERAASAILALERGAHAIGAGLMAADALHSLVVDHAPAQDKVWWHAQLPGLIVGMLGSDSEIQRTLAGRAVGIWQGKSQSLIPSDGLWRVVHLERLTAHGDIRRWVTAPWAGGRRCRLCGITENPRSNELQPFELAKRHGVPVVNGIVAITAGGGIFVHDECRAQWLKWVEIASKYGSQAEAEAADAAAGRKPRGTSAPRSPLEIDKPIAKPRPRKTPSSASEAAQTRERGNAR